MACSVRLASHRCAAPVKMAVTGGGPGLRLGASVAIACASLYRRRCCWRHRHRRKAGRRSRRALRLQRRAVVAKGIDDRHRPTAIKRRWPGAGLLRRDAGRHGHGDQRKPCSPRRRRRRIEQPPIGHQRLGLPAAVQWVRWCRSAWARGGMPIGGTSMKPGSAAIEQAARRNWCHGLGAEAARVRLPTAGHRLPGAHARTVAAAARRGRDRQQREAAPSRRLRISRSANTVHRRPARGSATDRRHPHGLLGWLSRADAVRRSHYSTSAQLLPNTTCIAGYGLPCWPPRDTARTAGCCSRRRKRASAHRCSTAGFADALRPTATGRHPAAEAPPTWLRRPGPRGNDDGAARLETEM